VPLKTADSRKLDDFSELGWLHRAMSAGVHPE
jgi:hypothetical protein